MKRKIMLMAKPLLPRSQSVPKRVHFASSPKVYDANPQQLFKTDLSIRQFSDSAPEESLLKTTLYVPPKQTKPITKIMIFGVCVLIVVIVISSTDPYISKHIFKSRIDRNIEMFKKMEKTNHIFSIEETMKESMVADGPNVVVLSMSVVILFLVGIILRIWQ